MNWHAIDGQSCHQGPAGLIQSGRGSDPLAGSPQRFGADRPRTARVPGVEPATGKIT